MSRASFSIDHDALRYLLGFPEDVRIVRVHAMPLHFEGVDSLRFVIESDAIPATPPGEECPFVSPQYVSRGPNHREFLGFKVVQFAAGETIHGPDLDPGE